MAEVLAGKCNAAIDKPDEDGLVYVVSNTERSTKMACLGTEDEAASLLKRWLGARSGRG